MTIQDYPQPKRCSSESTELAPHSAASLLVPAQHGRTAATSPSVASSVLLTMVKEVALPRANTAQMAQHGRPSPPTLLHSNLQKETTPFNSGL